MTPPLQPEYPYLVRSALHKSRQPVADRAACDMLKMVLECRVQHLQCTVCCSREVLCHMRFKCASMQCAANCALHRNPAAYEALLKSLLAAYGISLKEAE